MGGGRRQGSYKTVRYYGNNKRCAILDFAGFSSNEHLNNLRILRYEMRINTLELKKSKLFYLLDTFNYCLGVDRSES